jgi:hypothetical protein
MGVRRALLLLPLLLPCSGCSHYKTHQDCYELCKAHGLRFVEVVHGTSGYDPVERKVLETDACRCE